MAHVNMLVIKASLIYTVLSYLLIFANAIMKEHRNTNTEVSWTAFLVSEPNIIFYFFSGEPRGHRLVDKNRKGKS